MSGYLEEVVDSFDPTRFLMPESDQLRTVVPGESHLEEITSEVSDSYSGGAVLTAKILAELLHLSDEVRQHIESKKQSPVNEWEPDEKDDVHLFFAFVGQAQEYLLRKSVVEHVIAEPATTEDMKKKIITDSGGRLMTARECLDYLHAAGVVDDGLNGEIIAARNERNEEVHDITRWFFANHDPRDLEAQVGKSERSIVRLLELTFDFELE